MDDALSSAEPGSRPTQKAVKPWNADVSKIYPMNSLLTAEAFLAFEGNLGKCNHFLLYYITTWRNSPTHSPEQATNYKIVLLVIDGRNRYGYLYQNGSIPRGHELRELSQKDKWSLGLREREGSYDAHWTLVDEQNCKLAGLATVTGTTAEVRNLEDPNGREKSKHVTSPKCQNKPSFLWSSSSHFLSFAIQQLQEKRQQHRPRDFLPRFLPSLPVKNCTDALDEDRSEWQPEGNWRMWRWWDQEESVAK